MTGQAITDHEGRFRLEGVGSERVMSVSFRGAAIREWNNRVLSLAAKRKR
jgi:hypothetical protein